MSSSMFTTLLISGIIVMGVIGYALSRRSSSSSEGLKGVSGKDRNSVIQGALQALKRNPNDVKALQILGRLYYNEGDYAKAMNYYGPLMDRDTPSGKLDLAEVSLRYGMSAMKTQRWAEAYKGLVVARRTNPGNLDVGVALGTLEYKRKQYAVSYSILKAVLEAQPNNRDAARYCGLSLYKHGKYNEALSYLNKYNIMDPTDKEVAFALGFCQNEKGKTEQALTTFLGLKDSSEWGFKASLHSGNILFNKREYEKAIADYNMGLNHKPESQKDLYLLKYNLAICYEQTNQLELAEQELLDLAKENPLYRDVTNRLDRLSRLVHSKHLYTYLNASTPEFTSLCRNITKILYPESSVKIREVNSDQVPYITIFADVRTTKWEDSVLFRFYRSESMINEDDLRELYNSIKEGHIGQAVCLTPGTFSREAKAFVEARLITIWDKDGLSSILERLPS